MRHLYNLVSLVSDGHEETRVRVWVKKTPKAITQRGATHVTDIIGGVVEDVGFIEGRLRVLSDSRGGVQFVVEEPIHNQPIRFQVGEDLLPRALAAFRKRVEVFGTIHYRHDGTPVRITVTDLIEFPPPESLPDFRRVHGILRESP